jgi:hypothetical protein
MKISTSHHNGGRPTVKNCTREYRKNPTQYSGSLGGHISEYSGEIFLHFFDNEVVIKNVPTKESIFYINQPFFSLNFKQ